MPSKLLDKQKKAVYITFSQEEGEIISCFNNLTDNVIVLDKNGLHLSNNIRLKYDLSQIGFRCLNPGEEFQFKWGLEHIENEMIKRTDRIKELRIKYFWYEDEKGKVYKSRNGINDINTKLRNYFNTTQMG